MGYAKLAVPGFAELVRRVTVSVQGTACTSCAAAADNSEGRDWYAGRVGDYQIAPIVVRSTAMGRWRLMPPGMGTPPAGGYTSSGASRHLPLKGKAYGGASFNTANPQGEGNRLRR